ncbi:pheromone autoinducer 2 transporter [uncultured Roseburia sp.]|uniref:AI-2E family transporter n=1 Tax=Brotonthovivens ammoniilytica TaxID=2981725 RepID=A0ABT2TJE7_9FIRM|nr:AI-2E family transporter [Brotonthovivens ammoniilytica]MCU6762333.1 AI-2E family transporter [Brotonthovivens ammoniilytica]SCI68308.1 pheromone autoinducer 2 transporter [uncultured Roseburia sp.]
MSKKTLRLILGIITFAVILTAVVFHLNKVAGVFIAVWNVFMPFVVGVALAFILNVPMKFAERRILCKIKRHKVKRACSILATLAFCGVIIAIVILLIVPEIINTVESIINNLPAMMDQVDALIQKIAGFSKDFEEFVGKSNFDTDKILNSIMSFAQTQMSTLGTSVFSALTSAIGTIVGGVIGFVFSIYILASKEKLVRQTRMVLYAYLKEERAKKIWDIILMANHTFQRFISGQCLEACILGCMFWLSMTIFKMPYAILISVVIGVLALIPIFGAFVGCLVGFLLIVFLNPIQAVWFLVLFIVIQQIEGHFIYPFVIGTSVGLPSIWVLLAVVVGGKLFGVIGMVVFIPLCSVLYALFATNVRKHLKKKKMTII